MTYQPRGFDPAGPASGAARPRAERTVSLLIVAKLVAAGQEALCRIRNLSETGLMLETSVALRPADRVRVEVRHHPPLDGLIVWAEGGRAGMSFDAPVAVAALVAPAPAPVSRILKSRQPRGPRVAATARVTVELRGRRLTGRLCDISLGGAKIMIPVAPRPNDVLQIHVPGLPAKAATVRWVGEEVGIAFAEPLAYDVLDAWLAGSALVDGAG
ncbi:hypothetical protein GVO57_01650 [Sphingomonas changnyeongensis]|uniref:PilZ domain-containing protein n=1 Tax=Sphingomonas changnyeongensis TaxID=2698679 RepID=A0A7Z2NTV9_9SPHN|nr:PilZ domain-containing protein [Sphingomonas changnyeongensis]QHL89765.1 hypothetical protein GVO57_01650 [Sphingomonas changnyeongensis]